MSHSSRRNITGALLFSLALAGCDADIQEMIVAAPSSRIELAIQPGIVQTLNVNDSQQLTGVVTNPPSGEIFYSWSTNNSAAVQVTGNGLQAMVKCLAATPIPALVSFWSTHERAGEPGGAVVVCVAVPVAAPPPPTAPPAGPTTPASTVGSYTKDGQRTGNSNCNPPVLGPQFRGSLTIAANAAGNLGVLFTQTVAGTDPLNFSQFTATAIAGGIRLLSGAPDRVVNGVTYATQIELDFTSTGFTGRETFTRSNPPCQDEYLVVGTKR